MSNIKDNKPNKPKISDEDDDDTSQSESSLDSEFESKSQSEELDDYKLDGYHPVSIGDNFNNSKYTVIQKLGWGHFSTVWLVNERKTPNYFALKIQKSKKSYFEAAMDELQICEHLNKQTENPEWKKSLEEFSEKLKGKIVINPNDTFVIKLSDNFIHYGMHGKHPCSIFEVMGPNLLDLIQHFEFNNRFCTISLVKHICIQLLLGLDYIHRICGIIHTDLKPENVMFALDHLELEDFVKDLQNYKKKPISMKFTKFLKNKLGQTSNKNKKKYLKKKNKKKNKFQIIPEKDNIENSKTTEIIENMQNVEIGENKQLDKNEITEKVNNEQEHDIQPKTEEKIDKIENKIEENTHNHKGNHQTQEKNLNETEKSQKPDYDEKILRWKDHVFIPLDEKIRIKLVDFGNSCWVNKHFTEHIQTREYRSPEAILGMDYQTNTDIWSFACMVFEMLTNTFLFKPRKGEEYGKSDDHLALMIETLGKIPKNFALSGKKSRKYFNKNGQLIRIKNIKEYKIKEILIHDFNFEVKDAEEIQEFLLPMLEYDPKKRIDAKQALESKWLWN